jgi:hypothetical protein
MQLLVQIAGALLGLFGLYIVGCNYARQVINFRNRNDPDAHWSSPAPLVGPLFIIVGYTLLPFPFTKWIFLAFLLDPDTLITIVGLPYLIRGLSR